MKKRETRLQIIGITLAILLFLVLRAAAAQEDLIEKSFTTASRGALFIEADRGTMDILPSTNGQTSVTIRRKAKALTEAEERQILQNHHIEFTQDGNNIRVVTRSEPKLRNWFGKTQLEVRYEVYLPVGFDADLKTSGGSIKVRELTGALDAATSGGNLILGHLGPVKGRTSGGSIQLDECAANAELTTSGGDIKAGKVGGGLSARTSGGSIQIGTVAGPANLHTSGGNIHVERASNSLQAGTSGGSIKITSARGATELRTSGGDIHAALENGEVDASTSGGSIWISLASAPDKDCVARTSGGNIRVTVSGQAAFNLDAQTTGGSVSAKIPMTVVEKSKRADVLKGSVNGGGRLLKLRTSGGGISLTAPGV